MNVNARRDDYLWLSEERTNDRAEKLEVGLVAEALGST